jgi:lipopolysaccharide transport system permease protein
MSVLLFKREIKVRYAQTSLGILNVLAQPLAGLLLSCFVFGKLIHIDTGGIAYPLFSFSGIVSWFFFSQIVSGASSSLVESQFLIQKIYFPRMILLIAKCLVALMEFLVSICLLFIAMLIMGKSFHQPIIFLPLFILFNGIVGLSVAIWLSALTIRKRDLLQLVPYLINFGIWFTPVFYPATLIPQEFKWLLFINPVAAVIAGFRWSILGSPMPGAEYLLSVIPVIILLVSGFDYFRKTDDEIADFL